MSCNNTVPSNFERLDSRYLCTGFIKISGQTPQNMKYKSIHTDINSNPDPHATLICGSERKCWIVYSEIFLLQMLFLIDTFISLISTFFK